MDFARDFYVYSLWPQHKLPMELNTPNGFKACFLGSVLEGRSEPQHSVGSGCQPFGEHWWVTLWLHGDQDGGKSGDHRRTEESLIGKVHRGYEQIYRGGRQMLMEGLALRSTQRRPLARMVREVKSQCSQGIGGDRWDMGTWVPALPGEGAWVPSWEMCVVPFLAGVCGSFSSRFVWFCAQEKCLCCYALQVWVVPFPVKLSFFFFF